MLSVIGLVANSLGVFLMLRYGLPDRLPQVGQVLAALTNRQAAEVQRRKAVGALGLVMLILGTTLQAIVMLRDGAL